MKKILFLIHDLGWGGAERVLVNLVNHMDKSKFDITVQTLFDVGSNKQYLNEDVNYIAGWKHMFRGNVSLMKLFSPNTLCKFAIREKYDIVVSFLEGPCARILSAYKGKKVAWIHVEHINENILNHSFKNKTERINSYKTFDKIICVADTVKKNFESYFDNIETCDVLYNVNDTDRIRKSSIEKQDEIKQTDEYINIISVGKLFIQHKGFERLISIHKKLLENGINNRVYIVGEGESRKELQKLIETEGVRETCLLLGFQDNPYKYVANSDLFVCSSYKEGFSTAVTEALILGVPVVSTEVSGAKELLGNDNEYGIVTDNDENALYEGVLKMLIEPGLLEYYKNQAEIRGKEFSTEKTTKAVEEMLDNL